MRDIEEWIGQGHGQDGQNFDSRNLPSSSHMHGSMSDIPSDLSRGTERRQSAISARRGKNCFRQNVTPRSTLCVHGVRPCGKGARSMEPGETQEKLSSRYLGHSLRLAVRAVGSASRLQRHTGTASSILVTCAEAHNMVMSCFFEELHIEGGWLFSV